MKVKELAQSLGAQLLTSGGDAEVTGVYACDLLSRVMSGCEEGNAWITVQTHLNVLAVAELDEASCIIVPEGITVEAGTAEKAEEQGIAILSSEMTTYELCWKIHQLLA
ncbi:AraC family transcriptional regulator [Anaerovorax odorimutans]|uniref:AraC family transcriptional regulator n=1 Tax=Anaerovorax odorimutans TaxID=109327 RepID=A0ABT1RNN6_9FIRM|nr:AraC family transcriptional regulator [Anaerovorax odorimutans]MCQ4636802.1 AraC family transcriptional regulator [Anaerovorax odorimutans]